MRLGYTLLCEADEAEGKWRSYQLLNSAVLVSARRQGTGYQVRIAKPDKGTSDQWDRELKAMETFLGLSGWTRNTDSKAKGQAILYSGHHT